MFEKTRKLGNDTLVVSAIFMAGFGIVSFFKNLGDLFRKYPKD